MINVHLKKKTNSFTHTIILLLPIILLQFPFSKSECNIDQPILKNGNCELTYCSEEEFSSGACMDK